MVNSYMGGRSAVLEHTPSPTHADLFDILQFFGPAQPSLERVSARKLISLQHYLRHESIRLRSPEWVRPIHLPTPHILSIQPPPPLHSCMYVCTPYSQTNTTSSLTLAAPHPDPSPNPAPEPLADSAATCPCYTATTTVPAPPRCPPPIPPASMTRCPPVPLCLAYTTTTIPGTNSACPTTPTLTRQAPCVTACPSGCATNVSPPGTERCACPSIDAGETETEPEREREWGGGKSETERNELN